MYRKMDTLFAYIGKENIFMYIIGDKVKIASIEANKLHKEILEGCSEITKEKFESNFPTDSVSNTIAKTLYLNEIR